MHKHASCYQPASQQSTHEWPSATANGHRQSAECLCASCLCSPDCENCQHRRNRISAVQPASRLWWFCRSPIHPSRSISFESPYTTVASAKVSPKPITEIIVSQSDHVLNVCPTVMPKYSLTSQKPPSFTCEKISEPHPVASTSNSALTAPFDAAAMGATMPHAVVMATVAEPVARRISAATNQPSSNGDKCAADAVATSCCDMPLSRSTLPKPPPAPTISVIPAIGARQSPQNFWICARSKPRDAPKLQKLNSTATSSATSDVPTNFSKSFGKVFGEEIKSAQLPISIKRTGSKMVNSVMPKPGSSRLAPSSPSFESTNCAASGLCSGNLMYLWI